MSSIEPFGLLDVAEHDAVLGPQLGQRRRRARVVALEVVDREPQLVRPSRSVDVTGVVDGIDTRS